MGLSSPEGQSVNDGINSPLCSIKYASIDDATIIQQLGWGTLMAKLDLQDVYRIVPVHPLDRPLLSMQWKHTTYVDTALLFGLRSAPKIFSALADGLIWILQSHGLSPSLHYLHDFLLLGPQTQLTVPQLSSWESSLLGENQRSDHLLTFFGIEIDSVNLQLRLPLQKLTSLLELVSLQTGPPITNWPPKPCSNGGQTWSYLHP